VDTRLRKLRDGHFDALLLAAAGLHRLGYHDAISAYLDPTVMLPAAGQGALGIQTRADDRSMCQLTAPLADPTTTACCLAERRVQEILEGGCRAPMGALATMRGHALLLRAMVASEDGAVLIGDALSGPCDQALALGERLAARLVARGALEILRMGEVGSGSQES
jgi:hydroxymethylbilane synthase